MNPNTKTQRRARGTSLVEMMVVSTIFVLVATSIYRTMSNLTQLQATTDSSVLLQVEGQKAMNSIVDELRFAGFFRPLSDNTLLPYDPKIWTTAPKDDLHVKFDVPYLWGGEGDPKGIFDSLGHVVAKHGAKSEDEEYDATREMCFISLGSFVNFATVAPQATVNWSSSVLGATAAVVLPVKWQLVSYELETDKDDINRLRRRVRTIDPATMAIGPVISDTTLARFVEAVRFDTAQTDASLALYTVKVTIWLRKTLSSGQLSQTKLQSRVKLRNSVK